MRWLELLAVALFVHRETESAMAVALAVFLRQAPMFLLGAFAGVLSERGDRRRILLAGFVAMTAVMGLLCLLAFSGGLAVHHVAIGVFCSGIFWALDFPVRRTMLGDLAGRSGFGAAMALDSSTSNLTRMMGPVAGGLLMESLGIAGAYLAGVACFGAGALLLAFTPYRRASAAAPGKNLLADVREGFAYLRQAPLVLGAVLLTVLMNLFGFPYLNMLPVIGREALALDAVAIGSLISTEAATAFLTALVIAAFVRPRHFLALYIGAGALFLACILCFSFTSGYGEAVSVLLVSGVGFAGFAAMQGAIILEHAAPAMRARVMGVMAVAIGAGGPVGTLHVGFLADLFGASWAVRIMAAEGLLCLALILAAIPALRPWRAPADRP